MFQIIEFFRAWCAQKVGLHFAPRAPLFKQGEVWWCSVGMNIGEEIYGKGSGFWRPVVILKKFSRNSFLGLPLTSREKRGSWFVHCVVRGRSNWAMLNQARIFDARRLTRRIVVMSDHDFLLIKKRFIEFYSK